MSAWEKDEGGKAWVRQVANEKLTLRVFTTQGGWGIQAFGKLGRIAYSSPEEAMQAAEVASIKMAQQIIEELAHED